MNFLVSKRQKVIVQEQDEEVGNFLAHLDKSLDSFGRSVKSVIYFKFHEDHGLNREDIPKRPDLFINTIERMFGPGATVVKSHIENEIKQVIYPSNGKDQSDEATTNILRLISSDLNRGIA